MPGIFVIIVRFHSTVRHIIDNRPIVATSTHKEIKVKYKPTLSIRLNIVEIGFDYARIAYQYY